VQCAGQAVGASAAGDPTADRRCPQGQEVPDGQAGEPSGHVPAVRWHRGQLLAGADRAHQRRHSDLADRILQVIL